MSEKKYTKDHEWIEVDGDIAKIGITNHAQESLGDIVFIDLPNIGKEVSVGGEVSVVESVKAASDIYSPIDGEIVEINSILSENAAIINEDAESKGWIFKVRMNDKSQFENQMSLSEYEDFLKQE
jgi:glycine cleavage system H protein